jgi:hypothetical protein
VRTRVFEPGCLPGGCRLTERAAERARGRLGPCAPERVRGVRPLSSGRRGGSETRVMAVAKIGCGVKARTAVLLWGLVAASLLPSALPVVTRQAASLRRASLAYGHEGDDGLNAGSVAGAGAASLKPEVVADMGGAAHRGSSSLVAPRVARKPWDVADPGAGRASFWGEKSTAGEHEVLVRRAGMAAKRAKHPRRGGTGGGSGASGGGGGSAPVAAAAAPAAQVRTPSDSIQNNTRVTFVTPSPPCLR